MKIVTHLKRYFSEIILGIFIITTINPVSIISADNNSRISSPLKEISKLECRFTKWSELSDNCKQELPELQTKDYEKYAQKDDGYNDYTRIYTVLWGASYKYGWDVGHGGHMGTDIATSEGTPVYTIADGTVINAKFTEEYGNVVSVEHTINGKTIVSNYAHLSKIDVSNGDYITIGKKIGEVGTTGNSTGNHLHFQIDLDTPFHPAYYDYSSCPYSYYTITEEGLCFDQLGELTVDPILFLETDGQILDSIEVTKVSRDSLQSQSSSSSQGSSDIFSKTVYIGYPKEDIIAVQKIFREMGIYVGEISGDYSDIEETIIAYQIDTGIIQNRNESGAGRFGPKTRTQVKQDYTAYINSGLKSGEATIVKSNIETQKISRTNLLTREEIEAREVKDFLKNYNIDLKVRDIGGNIKIGETLYIDLTVTDRKDKPFKGSMPGSMTFIVDQSKLQVFPQRLFYFTDGKRQIQLTGLKEGNTNLYIKIGEQTIETIPIKIYNENQTIVPETGVILGSQKIVMGENKTGIVVMKDSSGKNLINLPYDGSFKLQAYGDTKICIKSGDIKNIKTIYTNKCENGDYKQYADFSYNDTVGGLVIFDYKTQGASGKIEIIDTTKNKSFQTKTIAGVTPKGLNNDYAYQKEVVKMIEEGVVDGITKGYFLEERNLSEYDALSWVRNTLIKMNEDPTYFAKKQEIENNLRTVYYKRESTSKYTTISREGLLDLVYTYLIFDKNNLLANKNYIDLDETMNQKVGVVFDSNSTWKDKFGENYFRPGENITRGEGAYLLSKAIEKNEKVFLTLK